MSSPEQATQTQLKNIEVRTGKSLAELSALVRQSGLTRHGEIRAMLQRELGLGYGDANTLTHYALQPGDEGLLAVGSRSASDPLDEFYSGAKAGLRPIHDRLMAAITQFGPFEIAPKKGYVSLRRRRQFAMIGPATNTRVEVGLNVKRLEPHGRLLAQPAGSMCNYKVRLVDASEADAELLAWIRQAYEAAG